MERVIELNQAPFRDRARCVLYWARRNRRAHSNHALAFAADLANQQDLPLLVYEDLTGAYPYASDRLHTFILEGVPDNARRFRELGAGYLFHLRRRLSDPDDTLYRLATDASALVTDDYPAFVAPAKIGIPCYAIDSSCIVPMRHFPKREFAAYTIRPRLHKVLAQHLKPVEQIHLRRRFADPLPGFATEVTPAGIPSLVASCEIDHSVPPSLSYTGGAEQAERTLTRFLEYRLRRYAAQKNEPSAHATSDLSPYLHFGHLSSLEVALRTRQHALEHKLIAEEFLEELIVRRELAFNFALYTPNHKSLDGLPDWARKTLAEHASDPRPVVYSPAQFEQARTADRLWNATQKELLLRGKIHGYYRMYWGKKIIEWAASHQEALEVMIHLHDKYALDGRDPATYTNILWCFGLHDRAWFERPIFGKIRYMSLEGMRRKTPVDAYLREIDHLERTGRDPFTEE